MKLSARSLPFIAVTLLGGFVGLRTPPPCASAGIPQINPIQEPSPALSTPWYDHWFRDQNLNRIDDWIEGFADTGPLLVDLMVTFTDGVGGDVLTSLDSLVVAHGGTLVQSYDLIPTTLIEDLPLEYPLASGNSYSDSFMQGLLEDWEFTDDVAMVEALQEFEPPSDPSLLLLPTPPPTRVAVASRGQQPGVPDASDCAPNGECWVPTDARAFELQVDRVMPDLWNVVGDSVSGVATGTGCLIAFLDSGISACGEDEGHFVGGFDATDPEADMGDTSFNPEDATCDWFCHGSRVFYMACGTDQRAEGIFGAAPNAGFIDINLAIDTTGYTTSGNVLRSLGWIFEHRNDSWQMQGAPGHTYDHIDVVNISYADQGPLVHRFLPGGGVDCEGFLPSDGTDMLSRAVNQLIDATGCVVVAAGGNCGGPLDEGDGLVDPGPGIGFGAIAAAKKAITVAAYDAGIDPLDAADDTLLAWSNHDRWRRKVDKPDVAAPGVRVLDECGTGTSFAAPQVSGVVALLREADPNIPTSTVQALLRENAILLEGEGDTEGYSPSLGRGRVDAAASYNALLDLSGPPNDGRMRP
jgi:subtilisin family serine protease